MLRPAPRTIGRASRFLAASPRLPGWGLALALSAALGGCAAPAEAPRQPEAGKLEVQGARATLSGEMGVAYFTVVNPGPESDRLVRVETAVARAAETHESIEKDGMIRMVARPEGFEVPAGGTLELAPGGKHLMLVAPRVPGDAPGSIELTLHFQRAGAVAVQAELAGGSGMDHSAHAMDHGGHDRKDMSGMDHGQGAEKP